MILFNPKAMALGALAATIASAALAHGYRAGTLVIEHPWARETAPGQAVGAGYLAIVNNGNREDRLVAASSPVAAQVQLHTMTMDDGVMRMRQVTDGLPVPAHGTLSLQPGGMHVMFMGLKGPLRRGTRVPATLRFQRAGNVRVEFQVGAIDAAAPASGQGNANMPGMDHGGH